MPSVPLRLLTAALCGLLVPAAAHAQANKKPVIPPTIPGGATVVTDSSPAFLVPRDTLKPGVAVAKTPPVIDFQYYPNQTYQTKLWSNWGDSLAVGDKYYSAIGDHASPGNAFVYEYDSKTRKLSVAVDVAKTIAQPEGKYTPGKIHSRLDMGSDGWLYFSTHRGTTVDTKPPYFAGDWILRYDPTTKRSEVVAHAPLPLRTLPTSLLDPDRLIFYAGAQDGLNKTKPAFLAYDVRNRKVLHEGPDGPYRAVIFARSTGRIYWHGTGAETRGEKGAKTLVRFDPSKPGTPTPIDAAVGLRACSEETAAGKVYCVEGDMLWEFDTKTETAREIGPTLVGVNGYITTVDLDPKTQRYLYYIPGAHGGGELDGSALVQYDLKTNVRKVIAFLHPFYHEKYRFIPTGSYGVAVAPEGDTVYVTWNGNNATETLGPGKVTFHICALTAIHIPESERQP